MSAATSSRSCATWSRFPSRSPARESARTCRPSAELAAEERVLDALVGPGSGPGDARELPQEAARRRNQRQGNRDRGAGRLRRHADVRNPRHAGRADGRHQSSATFSASSAAARTKTRKRHRAGFARHPGQRGIRQAARQRAAHPGIDQGGRAERHRLPRRDRQDRRRARAAWAPTCRARACSATCCR